MITILCLAVAGHVFVEALFVLITDDGIWQFP
jgi:hypothetical protein